MSMGVIDGPTLRKVRNRGWQPIRYRVSSGPKHKVPTYDEARHGWIIQRLPDGGARLRLVGEETNWRVPASEMKWITTTGVGL